MACCICRCAARVVGRPVARAVNWRVATVAHCAQPAYLLAHGRGRGASFAQVCLSTLAKLVVCLGQSVQSIARLTTAVLHLLDCLQRHAEDLASIFVIALLDFNTPDQWL